MTRQPEGATFTGFSAKAFAFLKELAETQDRAWFEAHKAVYEKELKGPLSGLVEALGAELTARGIGLNSDPKRAIFRIHRDVRFSADKSPYKTNVGAALTRNGEKNAPGVLYVHVEPTGCFTACGFYCPDPRQLRALRQRMVDRPDEIRGITASLKSSGLALDQGDKLTRAPRGFEAVEAPEVVELIRLKSFVVRKPLSRKLLGDGQPLVRTIADFAETSQPLLRFGWEALA